MAKKKRKDKKQKHNRGLKSLSVFLTILIILVAIVLAGYNYIIDELLTELGFSNLDRANIGISDDARKIEGVKTVLLLGQDEGDFSQQGRSDVIMLASINTNLKTLKLISIPRDTYVEIKDYGETKINAAYFYGGPELTLHTINSNFDLNVDDYVLIDYAGLAQIVDAVGGIELELTNNEIYEINRFVAKTARDGKIKTKDLHLDAEEGLVLLNGVQAVSHARNRSTFIDNEKHGEIGSDFARTARQRDIIEAVIGKADSIPLNKLMNVAKSFLNTVETSVPKDEVLGYLIEFGLNKNKYMNDIKSYQNPSYSTETAYDDYNHAGAIIVPYMEKTKELFNQYINEE